MSKKLQGRELYRALGSPKKIVAPMVDQSELAWRILSRRHGADLCYSPMYNARLFGTNETYRRDNFGDLDGDEKVDRPLVVQFCANNPDELLAAAKHVVGRCDAVDLNLGCPQGIARKGHYGSFLMEEWDLIHSLIHKLHTELEIPVTAKIRIFPEKEKTLEYAKMVLDAGAQFLTVHGRTREMKGQQTGLADWTYIKYLRDNLPPDTVIFANGNIVYQNDIPRCLEATGADAIMSAETNLVNPAVFSNSSSIDTEYPRVDKMLREYFEIAKDTPGRASAAAMKSHFFKILRSFLPHAIDIRNQIGPIKRGEYEKYEDIVRQVEERVAAIMADESEQDVVTDDGEYKNIPYWRCQPLFRVVDGVASNGKVTGKRKAAEEAASNDLAEKIPKTAAPETSREPATSSAVSA